MDYITTSQLYARLGEERVKEASTDTFPQTTPQPDIDAATTAKITAIIGDVSRFIDGYLAETHDLPLSSVPPLLTIIAADLYLSFAQTEVDQSEEVEMRYKRALGQLEALRDGKMSLGTKADGTEINADGKSIVSIKPSGKQSLDVDSDDTKAYLSI